MSDRFMILDGCNMMYRAFHALPLMDNRPADAPETPIDGEKYLYTNALHGFLMMLFGVLEMYQPRWVCAAFDDHAPTFRHEEYDEYKAGRKPTPEELRPQMRAIRRLLPEMGIPVAQLAGYEADDLMGTLSLQARDKGISTLIVSGDRDILQLTDDVVNVLYIKQGVRDTILYNPAEIEQRYGIPAPHIADMKGLMGDASDNIPGVPGVGEKTALKLLQQYGTLEDVYAHADEIKGKLGEKLRANQAQAEFSKRLATIDRHSPYPLDIDKCALFAGGADKWSAGQRELPLELTDKGREMLRQFGLHSALKRIGAAETQSKSDVEITRRHAVTVADDAGWHEAVKALNKPAAVYLKEDANGWRLYAADDATEIEYAPPEPPQYDLMALAALNDDERAKLESGAQAKLPVALPEGEYITHDLKRMRHKGFGRVFAFDTMLAGYVLNATQAGKFALPSLLQSAGIPDAGNPASAVYELYRYQRARLEREDTLRLYNDVELPFAEVLYGMECEGFEIDCDELRRLGQIFSARIDELKARIYAQADEAAQGRFEKGYFNKVNLLSPKQLGEMLFEKLELSAPGLKPRKTTLGYSTDADTLEALAEYHPIAGTLLDFRKYTKLQNTYITALLKLVINDDGTASRGRIHTSFDQIGTATGRISSAEPNLQNIPVRTDIGREIRGAFIARTPEADGEEWVLVDGDYSQIELRVLAHMAEHGLPEDQRTMQRAFISGLDIHTATAGEVFGAPYDEVTKAQRSAAKAVNFGIVYGISEFGLARNLGISRAEARDYIARYKERYPGIDRFMTAQVKQAYAQGYVSTLMGRRRYISQLRSRDYQVRSFGERAAMNSPIQGTAADIIKLAMVKVSRALNEAGLRARVILQVHDEIIIESPVSEAERVEEILRAQMSGVLDMDVPLEVSISSGRTWMECK